MHNRPPQQMSELERRRRAAARARRKKEIRRNRIIFAIICLVLLGCIAWGITALVQTFANKTDKDTSSQSSTSTSAVSSASQADSTGTSSSAAQSAASDSQAATSSSAATSVTPQSVKSDPLLTLVNNNVKMPDDWEANLQTKVADSGTGKELQTEAADAFITMKDAAAAEGVDLMLCSGYRSVDYQTNLFNQEKQKWLAKGYSDEEAYNEAKTVVAVPGYSEHNLGLAADIVTPKHQTLDSAFGKTDAGKWLAEHAPEYGFILRYPENKQAITGIIYEPWHFRYVGVENAKAITATGLCLEEYLDQYVNNV